MKVYRHNILNLTQAICIFIINELAGLGFYDGNVCFVRAFLEVTVATNLGLDVLV